MPSYQYKARDKFGKLIKGIMGADSEAAIAKKLKDLNLTPVVIEPAKRGSQINKIFLKFQGVSPSDINMFTRQFYVLQKAGLPILSSLNALKSQLANKVLKDTISDIYRDIETGSSLSLALERHPETFSPLYVNMIKSGEVSGSLMQILERLTNLGEHEELIRMRVKAASRYPIIVVIAIIVGFLVLTTLVIPRFAGIFSQFKTELPLPTQILLGINFVVRKFWWLLIILAGIFSFLWYKFINSDRGRLFWDNLKLRVPIFGPLLVKLTMSRFARVTGMLMHSGIPLLQILDLSASSTGNVVISGAIKDIRVSVNDGRGMLEPMKQSGLFPAVVIQMVSVGEETGKLDELLLHVSDYYDAQVDYTINNLVSLIEPILISVLGLAVLFMALGIFLPMWNLMNLFKKGGA